MVGTLHCGRNLPKAQILFADRNQHWQCNRRPAGICPCAWITAPPCGCFTPGAGEGSFVFERPRALYSLHRSCPPMAVAVALNLRPSACHRNCSKLFAAVKPALPVPKDNALNAVRVPKGVWLFDEIEKGCPEFKNLLIQIIYESQVTLASGRTLDFSDIYVIATSNLGSREILERNHLPFESLEQHVVTVMEKWFLPELLARFEAFIVFRPLDWDTQQEITRKRLDELVVWHRERHQRIIT